MNIELYTASMIGMDTLVNPSTILLCWIVIAHLYTRLMLQSLPLVPEPSGEQKVTRALEVEAVLPQVLAPQVLAPQVLVPQVLVPQNTIVDMTATHVSDLEVTIIDALFTLKVASARDLRKSLAQAIPELTLSQVNSTLYALLKRKVTSMTKDGMVPLWSLNR